MTMDCKVHLGFIPTLLEKESREVTYKEHASRQERKMQDVLEDFMAE